MNQQEFREIVEKAVSGDKDATAQLLFQCKPIIDHYSRVNGGRMRTAGRRSCCI